MSIYKILDARDGTIPPDQLATLCGLVQGAYLIILVKTIAGCRRLFRDLGNEAFSGLVTDHTDHLKVWGREDEALQDILNQSIALLHRLAPRFDDLVAIALGQKIERPGELEKQYHWQAQDRLNFEQCQASGDSFRSVYEQLVGSEREKIRVSDINPKQLQFMRFDPETLTLHWTIALHDPEALAALLRALGHEAEVIFAASARPSPPT
jgi:hypothetical protein